jgi:hypothetical protein
MIVASQDPARIELLAATETDFLVGPKPIRFR